MIYYSNVPLVKAGICPNHKSHNILANECNKRLAQAGPDTAWRIFYYADSIFLGMRNTATPQQPLGINPPEDEWWKIYMCIEHPTASTGRGNWPLSAAGTPQGANVMNPLNAYIFGRVTSENKKLYMEGTGLGPWAEGNIFDGGVVQPSRVLSNRDYFESSFMQRGAIVNNSNTDYSKSKQTKRDKADHKYMPLKYDPTFTSNGLFNAGRQGDRYWNEYASNTVYMRYAPAVYSGAYRRNPGDSWDYSARGVLKRKNAAKDVLNWGLWAYIFYFRGSEAQRSLFCEKKSWSVPIVEFTATDSHLKESTFGARSVQTFGPLNICVVGFDFYKYYTRQNILAPVLAAKQPRKGKIHLMATDGTGNVKMEQYRPKFTFNIMQGTDDRSHPYLGKFNMDPKAAQAESGKANESVLVGAKRSCAASPNGVFIENYDDLDHPFGPHSEMVDERDDDAPFWGKSIRIKAKNLDNTSPHSEMLMKCSFDNYASSRVNSTKLRYKSTLPGSANVQTKDKLHYVMAGYYLQTTPVSNRLMEFKLRIWAGERIVHEAMISQTYSYAVNRNADKADTGKRAYVFNRLHYFKKGINSNSIKFEIVPTRSDTWEARYPKGEINSNGVSKQRYKYDKVISFGNPFTNTIKSKQIGGESDPDAYIKYFRSTPSNNFYAPPFATRTADKISWQYEDGEPDKKHKPEYAPFVFVPSSVIEELELSTGDAVKFKLIDKPSDYSAETVDYAENGRVYFIEVQEKVYDLDHVNTPVESIKYDLKGEDPDAIDDKYYFKSYDGVQKVYFYRRRDGRLPASVPDEEGENNEDKVRKREATKDGVKHFFRDSVPTEVFFKRTFDQWERDGYRSVYQRPANISFVWGEYVIEKMVLDKYLFKVDIEPVILLRTKPTFHDAYALLRAATAQTNRSNTDSMMVFGDQRGVDAVGHAFNDSNKIFKNYIKYGSGQSIFGGSVVPALRQFVSANPIYESMRKFVSSYLRFADRRQLVNYTVEGNKGCLYFKRYAWGLGKKYKATILRNMEPPVEPVGYFNDELKSNDAHVSYKSIERGEVYGVFCPPNETVEIEYVNGNKATYSNGRTFTALRKGHVSKPPPQPHIYGVFKYDGITKVASMTPSEPYGDGKVSNEWIMSLTGSHYHPAFNNIYKASVYNDIMGFQNNRCHHRSIEYERGHGAKYDMIRLELCRVSRRDAFFPGPWLNIFLSKSSPNLTYVFNTNRPGRSGTLGYQRTEGLDIDVKSYWQSCPVTTPRPYKVEKTTVVNGNFEDFKIAGRVNPSAYKANNDPPSQYIRVQLDRRLDGTGRLNIGSSGNLSSFATLQDEPFRTDENTIVEYLAHKGSITPRSSDEIAKEIRSAMLGGDFARSGYHCKRMMVGDHAPDTDAITGGGYRHFGACYPRFYFLKLIPKVSKDALLDIEPYAQMDFYFRAMCGAFVNPYSKGMRAVASANWKYSQLASRSSEENPDNYEYIDPNDISVGAIGEGGGE